MCLLFLSSAELDLLCTSKRLLFSNLITGTRDSCWEFGPLYKVKHSVSLLRGVAVKVGGRATFISISPTLCF